MNDDKKTLQILYFILQNTHLCAELKYITKVIPLVRLEPVPGSEVYLVGLLNLAGESIPVIDLALRLGLNRNQNYSIDTPILICDDGQNKIGMIVDRIIGLNVVEEKDLQMHDEFNHKNSPFIAAIKLNNELSLLINMKSIFEISLMPERSAEIVK